MKFNKSLSQLLSIVLFSGAILSVYSHGFDLNNIFIEMVISIQCFFFLALLIAKFVSWNSDPKFLKEYRSYKLKDYVAYFFRYIAWYISLGYLLYFFIENALLQKHLPIEILEPSLDFFFISETLAAISLSSIWVHKQLSAAKIILMSFVFLILLGTLALGLPNAHQESISIVDRLFVATSAVCVTGLSTIDISKVFTHQGHWILLFLFQVGGLGPITLLASLRLFSVKDDSLKQNHLLSTMLSLKNYSDIKRFVYTLLTVTLVTESIGALIIYLIGKGEKSLFWSFFHAVSAFCNAGFSLQSDSFAGPQNFIYLIPIGILIFLGSLGFHIYFDFIRFGKRKFFKEKLNFLQVQTPIMAKVSIYLVLFGSLFIWLLEFNNTFKNESLDYSVVHSIFQSITMRTAGFNSIDYTQLSGATLMIFMILMVIGASPVSTGGGVKTSTVVAIYVTIRSYLSSLKEVRIHRRVLNAEVVELAISILVLYLTILSLCFFALLITQQNIAFDRLLFETISAVSTVGLSVDVTTHLDTTGKLIICVAMLAGRIGPLTLISGILTRKRKSQTYTYPSMELTLS